MYPFRCDLLQILFIYAGHPLINPVFMSIVLMMIFAKANGVEWAVQEKRIFCARPFGIGKFVMEGMDRTQASYLPAHSVLGVEN